MTDEDRKRHRVSAVLGLSLVIGHQASVIPRQSLTTRQDSLFTSRTTELRSTVPVTGPRMSIAELPKQYDPQAAQGRWYDFWLERGYFHADPANPKPPYCIV